jgi:hypothetical protein
MPKQLTIESEHRLELGKAYRRRLAGRVQVTLSYQL